MNFLLFHLKRIITFPMSLMSSSSGSGSGKSGSKRNKALMLGLPALIVAVVAVSAIGGVQFLSKESLESRYSFLFDQASSELAQLTKSLNRKQRVKSIDGGVSEGVTDEDRKKLQELRDAQKIYLDKLITIAPDNDGYRFDLARLVASRGDRPHALSILNELAPEDAPGFSEAHFVLAQNFFDKPARTSMQLSANLGTALKHVDHVLTRDENNKAAKLLKARILTRNQRYEAAYELYDELFEDNPNFYLEMAKINQRLERTDRDRKLYARALASFEQRAGKSEFQEDDRSWIVNETGITRTLQNLERFADAEKRLVRLIEKYKADPKGGPRRVFLQRILAGNYLTWIGKIADVNTPYDALEPGVLEDLLDKYTKAFENYPDNVNTLQGLARLSLSRNLAVADKARKVYDPTKDVDAPSSVLNQLGNHALMNKNFKEAIRQYERARVKAPRDSAILKQFVVFLSRR